MSKKKINNRLNHIFDDLPNEATEPPKQVRKLPATGTLSPARIPATPRSKANQTKSLSGHPGNHR